MQDNNCLDEDRSASRLREQFGDLLQVSPGLNRHWSQHAGMARFRAPTEESLRRMLARHAFADVRYTLWRFGGRIVSAKGKALVPDDLPLRGFFPGKFVEPFRRKTKPTGFSIEHSLWWKLAPFETRLVASSAGNAPIAEWVIRDEVESVRNIDHGNSYDPEDTYWRGQLIREFKILTGALFVRLFRWNPFIK